MEAGPVVVRAPARRDARAYLRTMDDVFLRANGWTRSMARATAALIRSDHRLARAAGVLVVSDRRGRVVGGVHLRPDDAGTVEFGWHLGVGLRGQGIGTVVARAVIEHLHDRGVARVVAGTNSTNRAAQGVFAKLGARRAGTRPTVLPDGSSVDGVYFEF